MTGGANILHQHLDPHTTELNKSVRVFLSHLESRFDHPHHLKIASYHRVCFIFVDTELVAALNSVSLIRVLALLVPAAFFSAIFHNVASDVAGRSGNLARDVSNAAGNSDVLNTLKQENLSAVLPISDASRDNLLKLSRGIAIILLLMCVPLKYLTLSLLLRCLRSIILAQLWVILYLDLAFTMT